MTKHKAAIRRLQRELEKRAPAEPVVLRVMWHDEATGEDELAYTMTLDGRAQQVIQLRWPEDEEPARDVAPERA